jgi:hypothetical protein
MLRSRTQSLSVLRRTISQWPVLQPPSLSAESEEFEARTLEISNFFSLPRFAAIKRPYPPSAVASKQGSLPVLPLPSTLLANKLFSLLSKAADEGRPVHTMGAIDPVQMTQMAPHQEVVYISGWAASSVLTTGNNEVGPDLGWVHRVALPPPPYVRSPYPATIPIRPCRTKSTGSSVRSNCTTESTTMNGYPLLRSNEQRWNTSTTSVLSSQMLIRGKFSARADY